MICTDEMIAGVCHTVNKAYCDMMGDMSQPPWSGLSDELKACVINGVRFARGPEIAPAASHQNWTEAKVRAGWRYGTVKDAGLKTHPNMVPYEQLPEAQRFKDTLFLAVVQGFRAAEQADVKKGDTAEVAKLKRALGQAQAVRDRGSAQILAARLEKLTGEKVEAMPTFQAGMPGEAVEASVAPTQIDRLEKALSQARAAKDRQTIMILEKKIEALMTGRPVPSAEDIIAEYEERMVVAAAVATAQAADAAEAAKPAGVTVTGEAPLATDEEVAEAEVSAEPAEPAEQPFAEKVESDDYTLDTPEPPAPETAPQAEPPPSTWQARRLCDQEAIDIRSVPHAGKEVLLDDVRDYLKGLGRI